ncbi:MAG: hypothetical protein KJ720_01920 [Proteobacteria bacterium]|nr:hypothetical protein [Pseudomonadota bacterium]MBU1451596.1 hypothetical protein [Pseudomonadota bacterium]MBU2469310.1 hypothetical protein [Pseudomonadota bacterium]MBU2519111.1 hypothetical protein [Pseudomonadota bacterium]
MRGLRLGFVGLWVLGLLAVGGISAWAGSPAWVQGRYQGTVLLAKEDAGPKDKGQATSIKADLKQAGDSLTGSLIVGGNPQDQIVLEITKGQVQEDFLWFEGEEMIWRCQFSGEFKDNKISGKILFVNQNPGEKLLGPGKIKSFKPAKLGGPLEMTRR